MLQLELSQRAKVFNALSDPTRLHIVELLSFGNEICAKEIAEALNITLALLCHHCSTLVEADLLIKRKQGQSSYYKLNQDVLEACLGSIKTGKNKKNNR
jgi:DNA-binding transcriptional ArsR family regulator